MSLGMFPVYPRVGGGTISCIRRLRPLEGLSPRGRGNRTTRHLYHHCQRSIPAWAGEPLCSEPRADLRRVYPRVGGGTAVF